MAKARDTSIAAVRERAERARLRLEATRADAQRRAISSLVKRASGKKNREARMASGSYATERGGGIGRGRLRDGQYPRGGGADYHLDPRSLQDLRRDAQDALRRKTLARLTVKTLKKLVIGSGPSLLPQTRDKAFNARKKALWDSWWSNNFEQARRLGYAGAREDWGIDARGMCGGDSLLRQMLGGCCSDGDVLAVIRPSGQLVLIEAERVVTPGGMGFYPRFEKGVGGWINGIEFDGSGRATRACVAPYSPDLGYVRSTTGDVEYVDLREGTAFLFRNPLDEATNQTRGEPALAAVLPELDELSEYDTAVLQAAINQSKIAAFGTSDTPGGVFGSTLPGLNENDDENESATGSSVQEQRILENGTFLDIGANSDVKFPPPSQPGAMYQDYALLRWGLIGAEIGAPIIVALMDPRLATYSGLRAAIALAQKGFDLWREELERFIRFVEHFLTAMWIRPVAAGGLGLLDLPNADAELDAALLAESDGETDDVDEEVPATDPAMEWATPSHVMWPPMPVLDPQKEVGAAVARMMAGLSSGTEETMTLTGRRWIDVARERRMERAVEKKYGLDKPNMIGQGPLIPAETPEPAANGDGTDAADGGDQTAGQAGGGGAKKKIGGRFATANGTVNGVGH